MSNYDFPKVYLLNAAAELPGVAAHLDAVDSVCFAAPGSIVLDKYDPAGTALQVLARTVATLETCISGEATPDIRAEFAQYWGENTCLTAIPHDAPDGPAWLVVVPRGRFPQLTVLTRDNEGLAAFAASSRRLEDKVRQPAYVIRLNCELDLPGGRRPPNTLAELVSWAKDLQPGLAARLLKAVQNRRFFKRDPTIFFLASNGSVGVELMLPPLMKRAVQRAAFQNECMLKHPATVRLRRWAASRFDLEFILTRNLGGAPSLRGRKIVLIGCGTIGSHLARFLVQGGAGHAGPSLAGSGQVKPGELWLIGPDLLMPGNIGRHLLGPSDLRWPKTLALAEELLRQFPSAKILPIVGSAMEDVALLSTADIVVDPTSAL